MASEPDRPRLAAIHFEQGFDIDDLLTQVCAALARNEVRLGGLLQTVSEGVAGCASSVHVVDLRTGVPVDIFEHRGRFAEGCRLDEGALLEAAPAIHRAIEDRVDLLVINRFGRAESVGKGLIDAFAAAIEAGIPTLTAVRQSYAEAWLAFHGGLATDLPAALDPVAAWALDAARRRGAQPSPSGLRTKGSSKGDAP